VYNRLIREQLVASIQFVQAKHVACYFSIRDEVDTQELFANIWLLNKHCYLPVLTENESMQFAHYDRLTELSANRYGILEPVKPQYIVKELLDIVLVPVLAFDQAGYRLGMGGGFYDKTFEFKLQIKQQSKPLLIGLAFSQQETNNIARDKWDVPLDMVITEQKIINFF